jgi:hypothetical protein
VTDEPCPILVFGSGHRCGSTLVQRLLTSHPSVLVWGEHGGHVAEIMRASAELRRFDDLASAPAREQFKRSAHQGWIANLLPEGRTVDDALQAYLTTLFARPAEEHGCPRWGFKEVRLGLKTAERIRELFPGTRLIHLTRDPRRVLSSLEVWEETTDWWGREHTAEAIGHWTAVNESFLDPRAKQPWIQSWRLEDVVEDPVLFKARIAELIAVDPAELDDSVFDERVAGYGESKRKPRPFEDLPRPARKLLDKRTRRVAAAYGYSWGGRVA